MPHTAQVVCTIAVAVVSVLAVIAVSLAWRRTRSSVYPLIMLGGLACVFNEPIVDLLGLCWHPRTGQWRLFETFGRPIPVWAALGYMLVFGIMSAVLFGLLSRGAGYRRLWAGVVVFWLVDLAVELPLLRQGIYIYYGDQPLRVGGFPLTWLLINGLGGLLIAVGIARLPGLFGGRRRWLIVPFMPAMQLLAASIAIPAFSVLNADVSSGWRWVGVLATAVIGVALIDGLIRFAVSGRELIAVPVRAAQALQPEVTSAR
ncbi:hypothetical protein [Mycolicibacterium sphagni]|nr:hypothetical protein [Mycolicibacterium sphagni]